MKTKETILTILYIISTVIAPGNGEHPSLKRTYNAMEMIQNAGYSGEEHRVQTEDGYILTLHRILPQPHNTSHERKRPVFLQHGLSSSSYYWLTPTVRYALPYILSDAGFDVWMGNSRGNVISQEHASVSTDMDSFWNYSFHEMGTYDLPAVIQYVLNTTLKEQIDYIGHSMGTTMFFVMASLRPDVAAKVAFMVALAPIATVGPIRSILQRSALFSELFFMKYAEKNILKRNGISKKTVLHYVQLYSTGNFAMYDYGAETNMKNYNVSKPPLYSINNISVPVLLCYGTKDIFVGTQDMHTLHSLLGNVVGVLSVPLTHFQFVGGKRTKMELFDNIIPHLRH